MFFFCIAAVLIHGSYYKSHCVASAINNARHKIHVGN